MLRSLNRMDLRKILAIENAAHAVPWTAETFEICFENGYLGWVIDIDEEIIGFIIISIRQTECHVLNLCIAIAHQHHGWGQFLLNHVLAYAKNKGNGIIYLEVRRSNSIAISLYRKMKFHLIGERKNYYPTFSGKEDALIFAKSLREEIQ